MRKGAKFFIHPAQTYHRRYEALRAYFVEGLPSRVVAQKFGYGKHSFEVLINLYRRGTLPPFFREVQHGRKDYPVRQPLRDTVLALRQQGKSIYDIVTELDRQGRHASHQTVWLVLREAGVKRLPKRP